MKTIKTKTKEFTEKDIPHEVMLVWAIESTGQPVGMETYNKVQEIYKKYPEWFKEK